MTEPPKKAVRLEDKLAEAEAKLAEAEAELAKVEARIDGDLRDLEAKEKAADRAADDATRALEAAKKDARARLGLTPARARRAVLTWAGLRPGEDDEAIVRGETEILDDAVKRLVDAVVDRDPSVVAANKAQKAAYAAREPVVNRKRTLEHELHPAESLVRSWRFAIRDLTDKISVRDRKKAQAPAAKKKVSVEDQARYVEARRRLAEAAKSYSSWGAHQPLRLTVPFTWPPKEE